MCCLQPGKQGRGGTFEPLTEATFERIIDTLEKAHHVALQDMCSSGEVAAGHAIPPAHAVLDADAALVVSISGVWAHALCTSPKIVPSELHAVSTCCPALESHSSMLLLCSLKTAICIALHLVRSGVSSKTSEGSLNL